MRGKAREYTSLGHVLEAPIFRSFMEDINDGNEIDGVDVLSAYATGIVAKKQRPWAKDSIDYIGIFQAEEYVEVWAVEIKS